MADSLDNITGSRLPFGTDHRGTFLDAPQCFSQVSGTADKRYTELLFVDVVHIIGRREDFGFVNVVNFNSFQNLCLYKMSDTAFCHNRDADSLLDSLDHLGIAHAGHAAGCTDIRRDPLQCHNGAGTGCFSDACLFRCGYIHNDTALQHLCQSFI